MALNIKDPDTDLLARELAAATGESITEATKRALQERLDRVRLRRTVGADPDALLDIVARGRARPMLDHRTPEEILGYDESGLPA